MDDELTKRPWRCDVTGNPVGTDTRMIGSPPCDCQGCRAADALDALKRERDRWKCNHDDVVRKKRKGDSIKNARTAAADARATALAAEVERMRLAALPKGEPVVWRWRFDIETDDDWCYEATPPVLTPLGQKHAIIEPLFAAPSRRR